MKTKSSTATLPVPMPLIPFVARISAKVIAEIRSSIQNQKPQAPVQMAGLVLGEATERLVSIAAVQPFPSGEPLEEAFERWASRAHSDSFDVVGWYAVRSTNSAELLDDEIAFHERHFPKPTDVAVLFGGGHTQEILTTVYARSPEALFTAENRRWGSVRLHSRNSEGPALVSIGRPVKPDFYLQVYETKSLKKVERGQERLELTPRSFAPWMSQTAKGILLNRAARRVLIAFAATFLLGGIIGFRVTHSSAPASSAEARSEAVVSASQTVPGRSETVKTALNPVDIASTVPDSAAGDLNLRRRKPPARQTDLKPTPLSSAAGKAKPSNKEPAARRPFTASFVEHVPVAAPTIQQTAMAPPVLETSASAPSLERALPSLAVTAALPSPIPPPSTTTAPTNSSHVSLAAAPSEAEARDYTPPEPLNPSSPHAPAAALRSLTSPVAIQVAVNIDKSGRVTEARVLSGGKTNSELVNAALSAAGEWVFQPATRQGQPVASRHTIVFQFQSPRATR